MILASRNVKKTKITNGYGLNIYDLLYHEKLLISKAALEELNQLLDPNREKGESNGSAEARTVDKAPIADNNGGEAAVEDNPNTGEAATEAASETENNNEEAAV